MLISDIDRKVNSNKGFSIIEMLVVIILITLLATISGSMFSNHVKNRNLKEAAACLMSDIKLAKQKSAAERTNISITINPDQNGYIFSGAIKNFSNFGNGIVIKDNNFSSNTINFQSRGTCSPGGSIQLGNSLGSNIKIIVSPIGRVRSIETYK
jgi:prepilin-type N-terminal cleavage/methylation domain-containing protein